MLETFLSIRYRVWSYVDVERTSRQEYLKLAACLFGDLKNESSSPLRAGWTSSLTQQGRFRELFDLLETHPRTIADVGCGDGELLFWLQRNGRAPDSYVGVEIVFENCLRARRRFPESVIICGSEASLRSDSVEVCVASGIYNFEVDGWVDLVEASLSDMVRAATQRVLLNAILTEHHHPEFARRLASNFSLIRFEVSRRRSDEVVIVLNAAG